MKLRWHGGENHEAYRYDKRVVASELNNGLCRLRRPTWTIMHAFTFT